MFAHTQSPAGSSVHGPNASQCSWLSCVTAVRRLPPFPPRQAAVPDSRTLVTAPPSIRVTPRDVFAEIRPPGVLGAGADPARLQGAEKCYLSATHTLRSLGKVPNKPRLRRLSAACPSFSLLI